MKFKRVIMGILLLFSLTAFTACSGETGEKANVNNTIEVDLDLTKLSSTMVYSEVYNMMYTPSDYIGKTIKMQGAFSVGYSKDTGLYYPAVIIADATACCAQGVEFVLKGNPSYPNGYPQRGKEITVMGTFTTYKEGVTVYCHLVEAEIL
ncbi:MAG: hypothetical protein J6Z36_05185 [Clostridia bacterium]|nr:hypothetical protein [Clostridia bacterium]